MKLADDGRALVQPPRGSRVAPDAIASAMAPAILLLVLAGVGFLIAGGARDDLASLLLWRPLSALVLVAALWMGWDHARAHARWALTGLLAVVALIALHLVPLPPALWSELPGRQILVSIYEAAGMPLPWRPMSLDAAGTWNALFAMMAPLAAFLLALRLDAAQQRWLLAGIALVGVISAVIGLLQILGAERGSLYFYRITNYGSAVGLFANRNHQAAMLLISLPVLAAFYGTMRVQPDRQIMWQAILFSAALFLFPMLATTGSRAGVVLSTVALLLAWWVYTPPKLVGRRVRPELSPWVWRGILAVGAVGLLVLAFLMRSTESVQRLLATESATEERSVALPILWDTIWNFFPFGSGIGSFADVFRTVEPLSMVRNTYLNHAHNEPVEILMTAGLPGLLLLIAAILMFGVAVWNLVRQTGEQRSSPTNVFGRCGAATLLLLALASIADYPLRVPSLAVLGAIAAAWVAHSFRQRHAEN